MLRVVILVALATCTFGARIPPKSWRIIGGETAEDGAFPYQVSLRYLDNFHTCGASILNENWILTAAHCVADANPIALMIVAGTNQLNEGGVVHYLEEIIVHADYDPYLIVNDIAVIKLIEPLEFNEKVQPIPLRRYNTLGGVECVLSGWGDTGAGAPNDLQFINLLTTTVEECQDAHAGGNEVFESEICTLTKTGEGACYGDSGGPLAANGRQIGIVSWGRPCAVGYPDVFTRIYSFLDWIDENTA